MGLLVLAHFSTLSQQLCDRFPHPEYGAVVGSENIDGEPTVHQGSRQQTGRWIAQMRLHRDLSAKGIAL